MTYATPIYLIFNSFALALATAFLMIVLWYDIRRTANQFFAIFLIFVQIWNVGFLIQQVAILAASSDTFFNIGFALGESGFIGASISLYALMTVIVGVQPRRFHLLTVIYLAIGVLYTIYRAFTTEGRADTTQALTFSLFFFVIFDTLTLYVAWRYRRKYQNALLLGGVMLFVVGQAASFLNPQLGIFSLAASISAGGALIVSIAVIRRELISPLLERSSQLESMHEVGVAITTRFATDAVLSEITERAAMWLGADAAAIYMRRAHDLQLVAIHQLPSSTLNSTVKMGEGVAGKVAQEKHSIYIENYRRDWQGTHELPFAEETFGSLICVPLIYGDAVIGVLMVISGVRGHLLDQEDVSLLELLAAQAAVTIAHGELFTQQKRLTEQLGSAHEQLRTVLSSTDNPVLAVDRKLNLIFTNPAADAIFNLDTFHSRTSAIKAIPSYAHPSDYREALRQIRQRGAYRYEIERDNKTYQCTVASLSAGQRIEGFVAVLNDVTELKELDRIKSEMVRMTSHDLKNPLQAAFANLELLRDDLETIENEEVTLSVDNIERQLMKMNRIIGGILDLERVRMGANPTEYCHPERILREAADELADIAAEQNVRLVIDVAPDIADFMGDVDQFKRAIVNIIENGIKFNKSGGDVHISAQNDGSNVLISIRDDGIGIPQQLQGKIFERFYRGHQRGAEHISGSGLGLSLVKTVVESHNGHIWVRSQDGSGTTFYIAVPAVKRPTNINAS